mmetsp:Transcript_79580/g.157641  ORF Transcript_79580/g.157641 Transcript_79580/m.157641 type:complete len:229 (+) Transcript_79580:42-728(+)
MPAEEFGVATPEKRRAQPTVRQSVGKRRRLQNGKTEAASIAVGSWVTLIAESRRQVDRLKADVACLVTSVNRESVTATVLFPNRLSLFLQQHDGAAVRFRTETQPISRLRACKAEDVTELDRKMILRLCSVISERRGEVASNLSTEAKVDAAVNATAVSSTLDGERMKAFVSCVAKAFAVVQRDIMEKVKLWSAMAEAGFAEHEINSGLQTLEDWNKIMIADDTVFHV